jgi:hypothetical protein
MRPKVAQVSAPARTGCAHLQWFGCVMSLRGCRSIGAALCCGLLYQHRWAQPYQSLLRKRWLLPNCAHGRVQDEWHGETGLRVRLCGRSGTAMCTVRRMDARQMHAALDSGCDENVHEMGELPTYGRVLVAAEVMALWRRSSDGRALRNSCTAGDGAANHTFPFDRRSGEISVTVGGRCRRTRLLGRFGGLAFKRCLFNLSSAVTSFGTRISPAGAAFGDRDEHLVRDRSCDPPELKRCVSGLLVDCICM